MNEAATRILEKLDRANGVWMLVEGVSTFNTAEMEADIRELVAERDALLKQNQALSATILRLTQEPYDDPE